MNDISQVRSPHFCTIFPARTKFKLGEVVRLRELSRVQHPALKRYGANAMGRVVGMRYNPSNYYRTYPYYVMFNDGRVFPIKGAYLTVKDKRAALVAEEKRNNRRLLRKIVEGVARGALHRGGLFLSIEEMKFTDQAIRKIRKLFE